MRLFLSTNFLFIWISLGIITGCNQNDGRSVQPKKQSAQDQDDDDDRDQWDDNNADDELTQPPTPSNDPYYGNNNQTIPQYPGTNPYPPNSNNSSNDEWLQMLPAILGATNQAVQGQEVDWGAFTAQTSQAFLPPEYAAIAGAIGGVVNSIDSSSGNSSSSNRPTPDDDDD